MEPTTPAVSEPVVDFAVSKPAAVAAMLLIPAVILLALSAWLGYRGFGFGVKEPPKIEEKSGDALPEPRAKPVDPAQGAYLWGMVFSLAAAAPLLVTGVGFLTTNPASPQVKTSVRLLILAAGGLFGLALMLAGLYFFIRWQDSLLKYFDDGTSKDLRWSLYALVTLLIGAGAIFFSVQPARADERNQPKLRRLIYGSNFLLLLMLLVTVLIAGNVIAARKVPNTLDTTEAGFYTLSPEMTQFLAKLDQPVTAYSILPPNAGRQFARSLDDMRRLLQKCQEVSNGKFIVRAVDNTTSREEIERLIKKYPDVELNGLGVLLTTGEDEKRHAFIRLEDLRTVQDVRGETKEVFTGESRLLKEMAFLTENSARPVVYFTQSNGELRITEPKPEEDKYPPTKSAVRLKEYLTKNFVDVRPLEFTVGKIEIPQDATAVVIAQPTTSFNKDVVAALRKYMTEPRADGKKGKLVLLSGTPQPAAGPVPKLGLEEVLTELNVQLVDQYLYGERTDQMNPDEMAVIVYPPAVAAGNTVAKAFASVALLLPDCRMVTRLQDKPALTTMPVLVTSPGRGTWLEEVPSLRPQQTWLDFEGSPALQRSKQVSSGSRPIAYFISEGSTNRAAIFGSSGFITDAVAGTGAATPRSFELLGGTIDWLRDRPTVAAGSGGKTYSDFRINANLDSVRLYTVPLALAVCTIIGIGASVWVVRRK